MGDQVDLLQTVLGLLFMVLSGGGRDAVLAAPHVLHALPELRLRVLQQGMQQGPAPDAARELAHEHGGNHQRQQQVDDHAAQLAVHKVLGVTDDHPALAGRNVNVAAQPFVCVALRLG